MSQAATSGHEAHLARRVASEDTFGRRLLVLEPERIEIAGAEQAVVSLDASGVAVLVVELPAVSPGTGSQLVDELDRIAQLTPAELAGAPDPGTGDEPGEGEAALADRHASFFEIPEGRRPELNNDQQAVVVTQERPDTGAWEELLVELGRQLGGVYLDEDGSLTPLEVPDELRRSPVTWPLAARPTLVVVVALLATVAVLAWLSVRDPGPASPAAEPASVVHDVVSGVPSEATHNQWIGQDHLVRSSDGRLLAVYPTGEGLQIVADQANQGRSWQQPATVPELAGVSSSTAIDDADRLHVAVSDGSRVVYAMARRADDGGWTVGSILELDASQGTPYVDVAYDEEAGVAYVVWAHEGSDGQAPHWAAVSDTGGQPRLLQTGPLAASGSDIPVLVNVAAGPQVVATYRRGDAPSGWFARTLTPGDQPQQELAWGREERVPTDAGIGAADLAVDGSGTAHLVLRDSTTFELSYFTRGGRGGWSQGETAVDAESIEQIDFPSLTVDRSSGLVYVFFQSDTAQPRTGVQVALRDPARGWQPPFPAAPAGEIPDGGLYPSSISATGGLPVVLWTGGGDPAVLRAATVAP